jgi:Flp pilus assembly protein TadG
MKTLNQKGFSTVEFALVIPLLLLLIVMGSEFGIMFYRLNALTKSVDIAARFLSVVDNTSTATAKNLAVYGNPTGTGPAIVPGLTVANIVISNPNTQHVQVAVTYDAQLILGGTLDALMNYGKKILPAPVGGNGVTDFMTLKAASVMRYTQ